MKIKKKNFFFFFFWGGGGGGGSGVGGGGAIRSEVGVGEGGSKVWGRMVMWGMGRQE